MVNIKWCCKKKEGIRFIDSNDNLALSYSTMAEKAIGTMTREKNYNLMFAISAGYYLMYYSLYSIMMKIGVKCEIHSCSLQFMKQFLKDFYSEEDVKIIKEAFDLRNIAQYYPDKVIDKEASNFVMSHASLFLNKSKDILSKINEEDVKKIKKELL